MLGVAQNRLCASLYFNRVENVIVKNQQIYLLAFLVPIEKKIICLHAGIQKRLEYFAYHKILEKLAAISDLFGISLDELVLDKTPVQNDGNSTRSDIVNQVAEKVLTEQNRKIAKKGLKIAAIIFGAILLIDVVSMIVYFSIYGFPQ